MTESKSRARKRTMAEEEEESQRSKEVANGCRRSSRRTNSIVTSQYRRLHQLFWEPHPVEEKKLKVVCESPNIYVMDDFLTASELQYCSSLFQEKDLHFCKSFLDTTTSVDNDSPTILVDHDQRTSSFLSLQKMQNAIVTSMEKRASDLLGLSVEQVEPLQLVRYNVGEFFGIHHDLGVLFDDGSVQLPPRNPWCKRRMVTIFVYLNNLVEDGGCTFFPAARNLRVTPHRGRAVLFCNILKNGMPDPRTVHAGEAPQSGVKYGLNIWACET